MGMIKNWAKFTALTVVAASVLAGCNTNNNNNGASSTNTNSGTNTETPAANVTAEAYKPFAKEMTAVIQTRMWGTLPQNDNQLELELEKKLNTKLDIQFVPADKIEQYIDRVNVQLASKNLPDAVEIVLGDNVNFPAQTYQAIKGGAFFDLTPLIESEDFATKYPELAKIPKEYWEYMKVDGKIYGIPKGIAYNQFVQSSTRIRQDLLTQMNLKAPATTEELAELLTKLTNPPERYGLNFDRGHFHAQDLAPIAASFTGIHAPWGMDGEGNFIYRDFVPEYKDFLQWVKTLVEKKAINPEFALAQPTSFIKKGKSGVVLGDMYDWLHLPQFGIKYFEDGVQDNPELVAYGPVKGPKGYAINASKPFDVAWVINEKYGKEGAERILEIANYTATKEYLDFAKNPIENVYYTIQDGKKVETPKYKDDAVWIYQNFMGATATVPWQLGAAKDFNKPEYTKTIEELETKLKSIVEENKISYPTIGLNAPTYDDKWKALTKDLDNNSVKVVMGAMSFEDWDKYVASIVNNETYKQIQEEFKTSYQAK
ncbi:hypothetical protein SY83_22040 [Paenibacillus swuensis]|uniref:ABC transporter substrate-binding protein n=1 Tax=Paenibacillus swuensis TaxID=1178515 RepID=A0A172TN97_9BACL|nr:hypothetical protein [Paenibacillus swuensis]ANE48518.1 hypothetical protein SY83_22040 [Paenibacillus swuensis]